MAVVVIGSGNADIASGLLHNDAEDDTLFNANFGGLKNGVVNAAYILAAIACLEHMGLVDIEESSKAFPRLLAGEGGGGAGIPSETHFGFRGKLI